MFKLFILMAFCYVCAAPSGWERISPSLTMSFPRDHGAHLQFQTEWWYVTGEVEDASGSQFGYQLTIFRRGLSPGNVTTGEKPLHVLAAHFAVVDLSKKKFNHTSRLRRLDGNLAFASEQKLHCFLEDWEIQQLQDGTIDVRASDAASETSIQFQLNIKKDAVLHGKNGYSQKGPDPGNASAYLSWTRLATRGTLQIQGKNLNITGESWFDHEWGTSQLASGVVGWDWFGLRFDDGRELMLYGLRRPDGTYLKQSGGTLIDTVNIGNTVDKDGNGGKARSLTFDDFEMKPLAHWTSPATKGKYPIRWRIRIPGEKIELDVTAKINNSELDTSDSTGVIYWEGPVRVEGTHRGTGYMELTGYAGTLGGRF
ncbi:MAG: lipocalin-like domain-containing protein [Planctomycetota bacterium]